MKLSIAEINRIKKQFYKEFDEWESRAAKAAELSELTGQEDRVYDLVDFAADMGQFGYPIHNPEELDDVPVMDRANPYAWNNDE